MALYHYDSNTKRLTLVAGEFGTSGGSNIQVSNLPTPTIQELNKIYQYIGPTTEQYTNGYFYKCVYDNGVYKWVNIDIQSGSGGASRYPDLLDKPTLNEVEINGDQMPSEFDIPSIPISSNELLAMWN